MRENEIRIKGRISTRRITDTLTQTERKREREKLRSREVPIELQSVTI